MTAKIYVFRSGLAIKDLELLRNFVASPHECRFLTPGESKPINKPPKL